MPRGVSAPPGPVYNYRPAGLCDNVEKFRLRHMPKVRTEDLIDAHGVADLLGLTHANSVSTYQRRYADMPRPVVDLGRGRCKMWLEHDIVDWAKKTGRVVH